MTSERHCADLRGLGVRTRSANARGGPSRAAPSPHLALHSSLGNAGLLRLLQARLSVSRPDDPFEQEAERVAAAVTRTPAPLAASAAPKPGPDRAQVPARDQAALEVRRPCPAGEKELPRQALPEEELLQTRALAPADLIQRQAPLEEEESLLTAKVAQGTLAREALAEEEPLARRAAGIDAYGTVSDEVETALAGLAGRGQPLPAPVRADLEPRFGADFSAVRIHTDAAAHDLARAVQAEAFTLGTDVVFGAGRYAPETDTGRHLLAHELTHVVQQHATSPVIHRLIRTPYPWLGVITPAIGANIRSSTDSSSDANVLDAIPRGQTVRVLAATGNWLEIESRYRGPALRGYVFHTLVDDAASASMGATVGTQMTWRPSGPASGTDFQTWASAATETPFPAITAATVMNCWEAVLLAAYRSGALRWSWIHNLYTSVPAADWVAAMSRGARSGYAIPGPNARMPQRGDIVFFDGLAHVALATGNGSEVYTFWPPPNTPFTLGGTVDRVKIFTIEALVGWWTANMGGTPVVEFAAPSW